MAELYQVTTHAYHPVTDRPTVLCIGGVDSAGLAGLHMDARSCEALDIHAAAAVTATTAQNNDGLFAVNPVNADVLESQIDAAMALSPRVIKIGMLASAEQIEMLGHKLPQLGLPVVLDTVLATSSEGAEADLTGRAKTLAKLLPLATVVTPNLPEAGALTAAGNNPDQAAAALREAGATWVVVKGGHSDADPIVDTCVGPDHHFQLAQPRLDTPHLRGTGCALASLIAAAMARGYEVRDALVIARMALHQAIERAGPVNGQRGCPRPMGFPNGNWPGYRDDKLPSALNFPSCVSEEQPQLGLYPIVDRAVWLQQLLPLGVTTIQLRIKDLHGDALSDEIAEAVRIARDHHCRLFINDYWQLAVEHQAYGVHLGQEDLESADLKAIAAAGLRLGVSNHCHYELARGLALRPSYIAVGPTYATQTKDMPWVPHGLDGLQYWTEALADFPLVAIAGIKDHNIGQVSATGVSGVAMITAITDADDPESVTRDLMARMANGVHASHG
ncbi:thiamine-phosphate diphosphorylase [Halioglobus japonicus]|nr:thiamine phosphate synthase [Halioglobus japonicus]AQA17734.1 thiamine-phosphate diphosphorylase [Halioglobus japonicus]GHD16949.1 bifunctional hydroxymethylpyrimidine kinase/phosphomethylpyrimidine kinase [Halioglobus japonicus]